MTKPSNEHRNTGAMAYSSLGIETAFVPAMWHLSRVSHMVEKELERVCEGFGLSSADINLLGAIWNAKTGKLRATDLADLLRVSNAVLSPRIARLAGMDLLTKQRSKTDRRAAEVSLTPLGAETIEAAFKAISTDTKFVRYFGELSEQDQSALVRILTTLHTKMLRDFSSRSRGE